MDDVVCFTDGSVKCDEQSGWDYSVRVGRVIVAEKSGAVKLTTSSTSMEIKYITKVLAYLEENAC